MIEDSELQLLYDVNNMDEAAKVHCMNLFDFKGIKNINMLNLKLSNDIKIIKDLPEILKFQWLHIAKSIIEDLKDLQHVEYHEHVFDTYGEMEGVKLAKRNFEFFFFGRCLKVSRFLQENELVFIEDLLEYRADKVEDFMWEKFESLMDFDYESLEDEEAIEDIFLDAYYDIEKFYNKLLYNYSSVLNKAFIKASANMIQDIGLKKLALLENDKVYDILFKMKLDLIEAKRLELIIIDLKKLPIYDWSTNSFITTNIEILMKEDPSLYDEKLDILNKQLDDVIAASEAKKANLKLYGEQIIQYYKQSNPVTKKCIAKDWSDYNYHSNKKDKIMHD
jgi:hypothetical protein